MRRVNSRSIESFLFTGGNLSDDDDDDANSSSCKLITPIELVLKLEMDDISGLDFLDGRLFILKELDIVLSSWVSDGMPVVVVPVEVVLVLVLALVLLWVRWSEENVSKAVKYFIDAMAAVMVRDPTDVPIFFKFINWGTVVYLSPSDGPFSFSNCSKLAFKVDIWAAISDALEFILRWLDDHDDDEVDVSCDFKDDGSLTPFAESKPTVGIKEDIS